MNLISKKKRLFVAMLGVMVSPSLVFSAQTIVTPQSKIPREFFGMHIHQATSVNFPQAEFGSWRLLDASVHWVNIQPVQYKWDFSRLDNYARLAKKKDINLLLPLAYTPEWAAAKPNGKGPFGYGTASPPSNINDWKNYVARVTARYNNTIFGSINYFEIWNEANEVGYFSGSQRELIDLAKIAYLTIKNINPKGKVVSPSGVGPSGLRWLSEYANNGGLNYADIVGFHFYVPSESPEAMLPLIIKVKEILKTHGLSDKPIWNTETGWWIANDDGSEFQGSVDQRWKKLDSNMAAAYVARALILGWASGLERFYWYSWDNKNMGFVNPISGQLKFADKAYSTIMSWMVGARMRQCIFEDNGLYQCTLEYEDGGTASIVWSTKSEKNYKLTYKDRNDPIRIESLNGDYKFFYQPYILVTEMPILIKNLSLK